MAQRTRAQLLADNAALFVSGTNIPAPQEKAYNDNEIDSFAMNAIVVLSNTTAVNDQSYVNVANATYTDPAPAEGKGYSVFVRNGTATIGAVAYSSAGTVIYRIYHFGVWSSYPQENVANKVSDYSTVNDTKYPSTKATMDKFTTTFIDTAPTVNDDIDLGYIVGSRVIAQDTQIEYLCVQDTVGDAIWIALSGIFTPSDIDTPDDVFSGVTMTDVDFFVVGTKITMQGSFQADSTFANYIGNYALKFAFPTQFRSTSNVFGQIQMRNKVDQAASTIIDLSIESASSMAGIYCSPLSTLSTDISGRWFDFTITFNTLFQVPE